MPTSPRGSSPTTPPSYWRRTPIAIVAAAVALSLGGIVPSAGNALSPADETELEPSVSRAQSAGIWQAGELTRGLIHNDQYGFDDLGLTIDSLMLLDATNRAPKKQRAITSALKAKIGLYISGGPDTLYAAPTAKALVAAHIAGANPRKFGKANLVKILKGLIDADGADAGRVKDKDPSGSDYSNLLGQAYALRGLAAAKAADPTVKKFLLKQQCSAGYFRLSFDDLGSNPKLTCDGGKAHGNSAPDVDSTAVALVSMTAARADGVPGLKPAIGKAAKWLASKQRPNGSFGGGKPPMVNTNTTGLAGYALAKTGHKRAALRAAVWIAPKQVTASTAKKLRGEVGAIALDRAALRQAKKSGITKQTSDQWRRSTAQAGLGLKGLRKAKLAVRTGRGKVRRGTKVAVSARGLAPREPSTVRLGGKVLRRVTANDAGRVRTSVKVPRTTKTGRRSVVVRGVVAMRRGKAKIRVTGASPGSTATDASYTSTASAQKARAGYPGKCKRKHRKGVTVAVDFRKLGKHGKSSGKTIVRCSPPKFRKSGKLKQRTGLRALRDAGISFRGTRMSGTAFLCRIEGRPARNEKLSVKGNPGYKEACVRTPPQKARWTYWHAKGNGSKWKYSTLGAGSRKVTPGGFEGWAFALNAKADSLPTPRVKPVRR